MRERRAYIGQTLNGQLYLRVGCGQIIIVVVPNQHRDRSRVARGQRIDVRTTAHAAVAHAESGRPPELCTATRSPRIWPSMRNTFSTSLSMPLVARSRKPSK
ncbi:MAG: TOBE domain-containing protein [Longimicrobiales bacterium]